MTPTASDHEAPPKNRTWNTFIFKPEPGRTESWWTFNLSREEFQREAARRHPSGVGGTYRRLE